MKKWILIAVGSLVGLSALVLLLGAMTPVQHVASVSAWFNQPPQVVWDALNGEGGLPLPFLGVPSEESDSVERLPDKDGRPVFRLKRPRATMTVEVVESVPPTRLVGRIVDTGLPFGGSWTFEISPENGGSRLTITEHGELYNVVVRFFARFLTGCTWEIEDNLRNIGSILGEEVVLESISC